ncbi:adenylate kinase family protein, partial [Kibdelosporangium lantanae]
MTRLVLVGPPGAGKGTQAGTLSEKLGVPHISTGDLFRAHIGDGTALGRSVQGYLDAGKLVPDEVTNEMVRVRQAEPDEDLLEHPRLVVGPVEHRDVGVVRVAL